MPPPKFQKPLSSIEKKIIVCWIAKGAEYDKQWSFEQPKCRTPPKSKNDGKVKNPIDSFVFKRLEEKKFIPSGVAKRETLIRRVTLDLPGLPPTLAQIDEFSNDKRPNAYGNLVNRLMGTIAYAQRRAQDWLDLGLTGWTPRGWSRNCSPRKDLLLAFRDHDGNFLAIEIHHHLDRKSAIGNRGRNEFPSLGIIFDP